MLEVQVPCHPPAIERASSVVYVMLQKLMRPLLVMMMALYVRAIEIIT